MKLYLDSVNQGVGYIEIKLIKDWVRLELHQILIGLDKDAVIIDKVEVRLD